MKRADTQNVLQAPGENYVLNGSEINIFESSPTALPTKVARNLSASNVDLLSLTNGHQFIADSVSKTIPTTEFFGSSSYTLVRNGQLLKNSDVVKTVSDGRVHNRFPDLAEDIGLPIRTTITLSKNDGFGEVLKVASTDPLVSEQNSSETSITAGSVIVTLDSGDYLLEANSESPANLNYTSPSGTTESL